MSNKENSNELLLSEMTLLLEAMILELELRGCENYHPIVNQAKQMQNKIKRLKDADL